MFVDHLVIVLSQSVERRPPKYLRGHGWDLTNFHRVIAAQENSLRDILVDLVGIYIEATDDVDVAYVVGAYVHMHETRDQIALPRIAVIMYALHEGGGAVA